VNSSAVLLFLLSFGHMCTDIVQGALPALLPFLKERFDLSYAVTGTLLMAAHLTSSVIQPLFGHVTDRRPFPILLPLGCAISGVGIALVPLSPSFGWLVAFVMFTGLGTAAFHPEGFKATACIASERRATGMSFFSVGVTSGSPSARRRRSSSSPGTGSRGRPVSSSRPPSPLCCSSPSFPPSAAGSNRYLPLRGRAR